MQLYHVEYMDVIFVIERMNKERLVNVMETILLGPSPSPLNTNVVTSSRNTCLCCNMGLRTVCI